MTLDGLIKALHQIDKIRFRPKLIYKIARGYFRTLIMRRPTLRIIEFSITPACQSRCGYCYASKFARPGQKILTLDEIRDIWGQAKQMGAIGVQILGGEPTLHPRFLDIMRIFEPRDHIVTLVTNAISLTEEMVIELKRMGVFLVYVSMNSLDAGVNDSIRGYDGHLEHALKAIDSCKKHGMDVAVPITTSNELLPETLGLLNFARKRGLQATINLFAPVGRGEGNEKAVFSPDFWKQLRRLYRANPGLRGDWDVNFSLRVGCPSGYEKVHIAPYGDVTGCSIQPVGFGNVREESLAAIIARMRSFRHYAKRAPNCIVAVDPEYIGDYVDTAQAFSSTPYPVQANPKYAADSQAH